MEKVKHTQNTPYGCGMYAIANVLGLDNFVTEERLKISKAGNNIGQLSRWLQEDGHEHYIDIFYYSRFEAIIPKEFLTIVPIVNPEDKFITTIPALMEVQLSEDGKNHLIGVEIYDDGSCKIYDSLRKEVLQIKLEDVLDHYPICFGFYHLANMDSHILVNIYNIIPK